MQNVLDRCYGRSACSVRTHRAVRYPLREELSRRRPRKVPEVAIEVRLIVVPAAQRDLRPTQLRRRPEQPDGLLEAEDPRHRLRWDAELLAKLHCQMLPAPASLIGELGDVEPATGFVEA